MSHSDERSMLDLLIVCAETSFLEFFTLSAYKKITFLGLHRWGKHLNVPAVDTQGVQFISNCSAGRFCSIVISISAYSSQLRGETMKLPVGNWKFDELAQSDGFHAILGFVTFDETRHCSDGR